MRRAVWSRTMIGLAVFAGAWVAAAPATRAQMCTPAIKFCESQADTEAQRCSLACPRYDTECADRCDDTHDIIVRYCWIKTALCKAADGQGYVRASTSERK